MEGRETLAALEVDAAPLVSGLVPTNVVDAEHLDASNVTIPGRIVEGGQAKLLSRYVGAAQASHVLYPRTRYVEREA